MASKVTVSVPQNNSKQQFGNQLTVPVAHVRRSSLGGRPSTIVWIDRLDALKRQFGSGLSLYASSLSLSYGGPAQGMQNLYAIMSRYSCCFGLCNVKGAALSVGCFSAISALSALGIYAAFISHHEQYLMMAIYFVAIFEIISSLCLFIGIYVENHFMLIPFQLNCVLCMMGSIGFAMLLLVSSETGAHTQVYPLLAALSLAFVAVYLWFLVIVSMCFVLFRDKKHINLSVNPDDSISSQRFNENNSPVTMRVNSSYF